ncbi:MAG: hypothetical protein ACK56G_06185 [Pirellulaceae bacterium]
MIEDTGRKTAAMHAWRNDRANTGNPDLATVRVASQHQLALLLSCPLPGVR